MIPSANTAIAVSAGEQGEDVDDLAAGGAGGTHVLEQRHLDARHRDPRADPVQQDQQDRERQLLPEVRDLEGVDEGLEHRVLVLLSRRVTPKVRGRVNGQGTARARCPVRGDVRPAAGRP
jgi:hypothetical protein